jgi:UDP-N-acetylglucosamine 2-epimerase (non-hydrolysing)
MKLSIILGTRPEIIKLSPIIRYCKKNDVNFDIIHSNQHYSYEMDRIFFEQLQLPEPAHNLNIGSGMHGMQTGRMLEKIEKILIDKKPDAVIVQGDTNTVLAGALSAAKLNINVAHVEAGLRSYDAKMPEEINRILTDHVSRFLFAPTESSKNNLLKEGISENKIYVVGNTIVDATFQNIEIGSHTSKIMDTLNLNQDLYFLMTIHRVENVDSYVQLKKLVILLKAISDRYDYKIVFPVHPRTMKQLISYGFKNELDSIENLRMMEPTGYLDFLVLEKNARLILTDSGGIQEEACILKIPCITIRDNTERPETVDIGSNMIAGIEMKSVISAIEKMLICRRDWHQPYGDGDTGEKIVDILGKEL